MRLRTPKENLSFPGYNINLFLKTASRSLYLLNIRHCAHEAFFIIIIISEQAVTCEKKWLLPGFSWGTS